MNHQHRIATAGSGVAALALASCLALAGCSGGQPASSAAGRPGTSAPALPALSAPSGSLPSAGPAPVDRSLSGIHACSLVPASVVAQVLGALSEPPAAPGDGLSCFYNTQLTAGEGGPSYILSVFTRSGYEESKAFATGVGESGAAQFTSVTGLGTDAFSLSTDSGGPSYSLSAVQGGVSVNVEVNDLGTGKAKARELVATALAHL
jgi:hypothetical protein